MGCWVCCVIVDIDKGDNCEVLSSNCPNVWHTRCVPVFLLPMGRGDVLQQVKLLPHEGVKKRNIQPEVFVFNRCLPCIASFRGGRETYMISAMAATATPSRRSFNESDSLCPAARNDLAHTSKDELIDISSILVGSKNVYVIDGTNQGFVYNQLH